MEELLSYYRKILRNVGLRVNDEGYIYIGDTLFIVKDKPLVLPTENQLSSVMEKNENGEYVIAKIPFNPLNEDVIKGDSESLKRLKRCVERHISKSLGGLVEVLLTLASNKDLQKETSLEVNKFLGSLSDAKNIGVKQVIDDKTISNWVEINKAMIKQGKLPIDIYLKKTSSYKGTKYNRLATLNSPLYEEIKQATKEAPVFGIKLRPKDITVFNIAFKFILKELDENDVISIGSNDNVAPGYVSLMTLYVTVMSRINKIFQSLKDIDPEMFNQCYIEDLITEEEILDISKYKKWLSVIPNDTDLVRDKANKNRENTESNANNASGFTGHTQNHYPQSPQAIVDPNENDPVMLAYRRNNPVLRTNYIPAQPYMPSQPASYMPPQTNMLAIPANSPVGGMNGGGGYYAQPQYVYQQPTVGHPGSYYNPNVSLAIPVR